MSTITRSERLCHKLFVRSFQSGAWRRSRSAIDSTSRTILRDQNRVRHVPHGSCARKSVARRFWVRHIPETSDWLRPTFAVTHHGGPGNLAQSQAARCPKDSRTNGSRYASRVISTPCQMSFASQRALFRTSTAPRLAQFPRTSRQGK